MKNIYCYGMVNPSMVYLLKKGTDYPEANGYGEVEKIIPSVGGEAVNTAIMLSKLGIKSTLDGTWLVSEKADQVRELLSSFDIDISRLKNTDLNGPSEILIADGTNRTCFGNFDTYQNDGRKWNVPKEKDVKNASIVALDPYFKEETLSIANFCHNFNIPYVTLDCNYDSFVAIEAEVIVISQEHRDWNYSKTDPEELFTLYQKNCKGLIIFTFGSEDVWYGRKGENRKNKKPFTIDPIDTTAAGDTFRAGIIYGLLNNMSDEDIVTFANAVSACVCLSVPHSINATDLKGVLDFLDKQI